MFVRMKISNSIIFFATILIMIFAKFLKIFVLDDNFFYDSNLLLDIMNGIRIVERNNYNYGFAANVYNFINFCGINNVIYFDIIFGIIFTFVLLIIEKYLFDGNYSLVDLLFIFLYIFFVNVYTFSLSKDLIQFVLYCIFVVCILKFKNNKIALLISLIPIAIIAFFLRNYFIAVVFAFVLLFFLFSKIKSKKTVFMIVLVVVLALLFSIFMLEKINSNLYQQILKSNEVYSDQNANSKFHNLLPNDNFFYFSLNYIINFARFMFPFELLLKGAYYYVFIIYQMILLVLLFKSTKNNYINPKYMMLFSMAVAYYMICILFEPDFGSFLRHQISITIIYLPMFFHDWSSDKNAMCFECCYN